jgi:hypothetical protein
MTSRNGQTFHRWKEAIIPPGLNKDRWHNRSNYIWWGLVETESNLPGLNNELSLYTNERYYKTKGVKTRRYTYRLDGFVSVHAPFEGGSILTEPIIFEGRRLLLNVSTSAAGSVRVELQDARGKPIDGYEASNCINIYGDAIERTVQWKNGKDVSPLQDKSIRLLFHLKDADLYAFRFGDSNQQEAGADAEEPSG